MTDVYSSSTHDNDRYCNGQKRQGRGLCHRPAGWGTTHPGQGRCKLHFGNNPVTHGRYSLITRPAIRQRLDALEAADADPLDLLDELRLLRALTIDFIERYDEYTEALLAWHASFESEDHPHKPRQILDIADAGKLIRDIGRIAETIQKLREQQTISLETFKRLMEQMAITVSRHADADTCGRIEAEWDQIRLDPQREPRR